MKLARTEVRARVFPIVTRATDPFRNYKKEKPQEVRLPDLKENETLRKLISASTINLFKTFTT